jgi:hypothetical protein
VDCRYFVCGNGNSRRGAIEGAAFFKRAVLAALGGAAFITTLLGTIKVADWGTLTGSGTNKILTFMTVIALSGAIAGFFAMGIVAVSYGVWKDRQMKK